VRLSSAITASALLLCGHAGYAQSPPDTATSAVDSRHLKGKVLDNAPRVAHTVKSAIAKANKTEGELFADERGLLAVLPGSRSDSLRKLARELEEIPGVRQALTDTPRRMLLLIFDSASRDTTPEFVAGPLEELRRGFKKRQSTPKPVTGPLGGLAESPPARPPGQPEPGLGSPAAPRLPKLPEEEPTPPANERAEPEPAKAPEGKPSTTAKRNRDAPPNGSRRHVKGRTYSWSPEPLTEELVEACIVEGPIHGRRALELWLTGKDRPLSVAIARAAIKKRERDAEAGAVLAMYHLNRGYKLKAYRNMRSVTHYRPDSALFRRMYAEVLRALGLNDRAREEELQAMRIDAVKRR
jgi:hypothetical protein